MYIVYFKDEVIPVEINALTIEQAIGIAKTHNLGRDTIVKVEYQENLKLSPAEVGQKISRNLLEIINIGRMYSQKPNRVAVQRALEKTALGNPDGDRADMQAVQSFLTNVYGFY